MPGTSFILESLSEVDYNKTKFAVDAAKSVVGGAAGYGAKFLIDFYAESTTLGYVALAVVPTLVTEGIKYAERYAVNHHIENENKEEKSRLIQAADSVREKLSKTFTFIKKKEKDEEKGCCTKENAKSVGSSAFSFAKDVVFQWAPSALMTVGSRATAAFFGAPPPVADGIAAAVGGVGSSATEREELEANVVRQQLLHIK